MKNKKKSLQGQALLEFFPIAISLFPLLFGLFSLAGVFFSVAWIDFWTYEAAICLAKNKRTYICKKDWNKKITTGNFFLDIQNTKFQKNKNYVNVETHASANLFVKKINRKINHKIYLPLIPRKNEF